MINKLELGHALWKNLDEKELPSLLHAFSGAPDTDTTIFSDLQDCIWDSGTCKSGLYYAFPHLVEIAAAQEFSAAKELWCYLGCWASSQEYFREPVPDAILKWFDESLSYAEETCAAAIAQEQELDEYFSSYLFACLFAFARHDFGRMTMSGYKDSEEGTSAAKCQNGHIQALTVYDSSSVAYDEKEQAKPVPEVPGDSFDFEFIKRAENPWGHFEPVINGFVGDLSIPEEIRTHLRLAQLIVRNGVSPDLPMRFAFSLYGSLLFCYGNHELANRAFHGWDVLECPICGNTYIFANHWYTTQM
jgi:hypothetical protein